MKIVSSQTSSIDIRLTESLTTAAGGIGDRGGVRLTITTNTGSTGVGESAPIPGVSGPRLESIASEIDAWSQDAIDRDVQSVIENLDDTDLSPLARFAVHTALIDLVSQAAGAPMSQWLRAGAPATVHVNGLVAETNPGAVHAHVLELAKMGVRAVKLKVAAEEPALDVTRIIAASEAGGPSVELRLDANGAWDAETVERVVGRVGKHRLSYIEDPTSKTKEYRDIQEAIDVPIALDVPLSNDPLADITRANVNVIVLKPAAVGGVDRIMDLARTLDDARLIVSSSIDREIALSAAIHVAAALPNENEAHGLAIGSVVRNLPESLHVTGATVAVPTGPGVYRIEE